MESTTASGGQEHFSPDGLWAWDGQTWTPTAHGVDPFPEFGSEPHTTRVDSTNPQGTGYRFEHSAVGITVLLSVLTLGIYWLVWLYPRMVAAANTSGRSGQNVVVLFWVLVGSLVASVTVLPFIGLLAALVVGGVLLNEILKDRDQVAARNGIGAQMHNAGSVMALYLIGNLLALTIIGLPIAFFLAILYYMWMVQDFNRLSAVTSSAPTALPTPSQVSPVW